MSNPLLFEKSGNIEIYKDFENLLKVLENMFFSMPIPEDIVQKYNFIKESRYKRMGIPFYPITKAQYPLIGTKQGNTNEDYSTSKLFMTALYYSELCIKSYVESLYIITRSLSDKGIVPISKIK